MTAKTLCVAAVAAAAALLIAACGATSGGDTSSPLGNIDRATKTVQLNLFLSEGRINGYASGQLTVRVPRGWRVDVYCSNRTATPDTCAIGPHAGTRVPPGKATDFGFVARTPGSYRVTSGGRPWEHFDIVATGRPSVAQPGRDR